MLTQRWLIYTLLKIGIVQAQCYFPGGDLAPNHQPCNPYAFTSLCCESGWTCFDNGLCVVTDPASSIPNLSSIGSAARGTCTNPLWNDTACGNFCLGRQCRGQTPLLRHETLAEGILDDPVNDNDGSVISCGSQHWCCQPGAAAGTCNCASGDGTFSLQEGSAQTIIGIEGLESTSTDAIPISSASIPSITASYTATTASSTLSKTDVTQDEPTTSISPGYITSSSASATSPATSSSSASHSSQSILTMTLQPTIITMLPPSGVPTTSGSSSPTASAVSSGGKTHSTAFIAGVAAGSAIAGAAVMGGFYWLHLRRRRRQTRRGDFIHHNPSSPAGAGHSDPLVTENTNQDIDYRTRWPLQRSPPESLPNRSGHDLHPLVPDHDTDRPAQPNLYGPLALDPYAVPPRDPDVRGEASRLQHRPGVASPLNHRPTMRGANRPRRKAYRTMPRAPQAWMPEVPEMTRDWPTGEQR